MFLRGKAAWGVAILALTMCGRMSAEDFSDRLTLVCEAYGKNLVAIRDEEGKILWKQKVRGGQHDVHLLDNGNVLLQDGWVRIVEMTLDKKIVWKYDAAKMNGNAGKRVEVHAFLRLDNGLTMIAESGPRRIIEVDAAGAIQRSIPLTVEKPHHHRDTRLVRLRKNGHYLVCHEADGKVREYDGTGKVVWEYNVRNKVYGAIGLKNGNTLIATGGGSSVIEVTKGGETVWEISRQVPGTNIGMRWMTTLRERKNGNLIIGNCHAGPKNPQMFEITRDKKVVWRFHDFKNFGNGVAAGEVLTPAQAKLVREKLASIPESVRISDKTIDFSQPLAARRGSENGFHPLYNGRNLDGWETQGNWLVKPDGVLAIKPRAGERGWRRFDAYLWADKRYGDFALDLEFKIPKGGNSGVFVRVKDKKNPVNTGIEVQINDVHGKKKVGPHDCGGIIGTVGPSKNMAKPAGEWNRMIVTCRGTRLQVQLNGEQVVDVNLKTTSRRDRPLTGFIGLQDHGLNLFFRNIRIKELTGGKE